MLRRVLLRAAASRQAKRVVVHAPLTRGLVSRFVAGEDVDSAVTTARKLVANGLLITVDRLGEMATDADTARATADAYVDLLGRIADSGLAEFAEVSVKLSAVGQALERVGEQVAVDHAREICAAAKAAGTTVTLDMEDHTTTDATLAALQTLRVDFPNVGAVLQAYLRRTEADCRDLAGPGSRIRLCKGAYREPPSVAFQQRADVDRSYVRCLRILMHGKGYPMVATHDPRLVAIAGAMALQSGRAKGDYEYQMLFGVRPDEQGKLVSREERVRVYVPYGTEWYPYLTRRLAERPANMAFFLRAIASRG